MASTFPEPKFGAESFSCPHCDAVAHHEWYSLFLKPEKAADLDILTPEGVSERDGISELEQFVQRLRNNELTYEYQKHPQPMKVRMANLHVSRCNQCNGFAIWVSSELVFPRQTGKMPELAEQDLEEAATVLKKSPVGSAALMRLCIQKLVPLLSQNGKGLDEHISSLVRKGLEVEIQQAMGVLEVIQNDPARLTKLESEEEQEMALKFFDSLKAILERRAPQNRDEK
jgi:hypothetical protein